MSQIKPTRTAENLKTEILKDQSALASTHDMRSSYPQNFF